jgi:hypothetical protein
VAVLPKLSQYTQRERKWRRKLRCLQSRDQSIDLFGGRSPLTYHHLRRSTGSAVGEIRRGAGGVAKFERAQENGRRGTMRKVRSGGGWVLYSTTEERR